MALTKRTYVDGETIITAQNLNDIQDEIISLGNSTVPKTRKVNGHGLSSDITLTPSDVAFSSGTTYSSGSIGKSLVDLIGVVNGINLADVQSVTTANTSCNDYTTGGIYYFQSAYVPSDKPDGSSNFGFLIVVQNGGSNARIFQIWVNQSTSSGAMYFRSCSGSTLSFSNWRQLAFGDLATKELTPTVVSTLPTGVTAVGKVAAVQSGNVVTVYVGLTRDTTDITSYTAIASGLPAPKIRPLSGSYTIPFGQITPASDTFGRPLNLVVGSTGNLSIARGKAASGTVQFLGSFTYITDEI